MDKDKVETMADRTRVERKVERVAVVFTHGQGEQVPMQDVIALADSVWTRDSETERSDPKVSRNVWSVPVYDGDMSEQRRLVTSTLKRGDGQDDLQVDFYQFYWADLMTGNQFIHVWHWFRGLMDRPTAEVPSQLTAIRRTAMFMGLVVAMMGLVFGAVTLVRILNANLLSWANFYALMLIVALGFQTYWIIRPAYRARAMMGGLGLILASLTIGVFSAALLQGECQFVELAQDGPGCVKSSFNDLAWADAIVASAKEVLQPAMASSSFNLSAWVSVAHSAMAAGVISALGGLSIVGYWLSKQFFVPVMADSARMLRGTPENIPARDRIRKRGMELMEALHNSERRYDRVIFLAHSLGTVVAYNVLMQYWGNVYRLFNHPASKAEREAVETAAAAMSKATGEKLAKARLVFRAKARAYQNALCAPKSRLDPNDVEWRTSEYASDGQLLRTLLRNDRLRKRGAKQEDPRSPWLVTDFITIGSPLTYGSLLMAGSDKEFQSYVDVRRYAICPPSETAAGSFSHADRPHHAALFGATCWTNIFFETEGLINGDIIGGEIGKAPPKGFGPGVLDVAVRRPPGTSFVHNEYWPWREEPDGSPSEHIRALRSALHLFGHADEADAELKALAPPRTKLKAGGAA